MKSLEKLVQEYIFNVGLLSSIERGEIESTLADVLELNERFNINLVQLKKAIEDEYDLEFDETCDCEAQQKLNILCDEEVAKQLIILHESN